MPEKVFTKGLKNQLKNSLNGLFEERGVPLYAVKEFGKGRLIAPNWAENTIVDIAILSKNVQKNSIFRLVAIEIEFISSVNQIYRNFSKLLNYANRHKNVKVGLLHLIFWEANISKRQLVEISKLPLKTNDSKFYYQLYLCDEHDDLRAYKSFAELLIYSNWKFGARLFSLLEIIFGKQTFNAGKIASKMNWW
jgi:hypothetical protein